MKYIIGILDPYWAAPEACLTHHSAEFVRLGFYTQLRHENTHVDFRIAISAVGDVTKCIRCSLTVIGALLAKVARLAFALHLVVAVQVARFGILRARAALAGANQSRLAIGRIVVEQMIAGLWFLGGGKFDWLVRSICICSHPKAPHSPHNWFRGTRPDSGISPHCRPARPFAVAPPYRAECH